MKATMRQRLERLAGALGVSAVAAPSVFFEYLRDWPEADQLAYGQGNEAERDALVQAHAPGSKATDIVFIVESELSLNLQKGD